MSFPTKLLKVSLTQDIQFPSRALGTIYQNTTGYPMFVMVSALCHHGDSSGTAHIEAYVGDATPPTSKVGEAGSHVTNIVTIDKRYQVALTFTVPAGYYYRVNAVIVGGGGMATIDLTSWAESRLIT